MVSIRTTMDGKVKIRMGGCADTLIKELDAVAIRIKKLSRDLMGIGERLCSDSTKIDVQETRCKKPKVDN